MGWGYLRFAHFKQLLDDNPHIRSVAFDCFGEMFLNKELLPMIEYGTRKGVVFRLASANFNTVRDGVLEGLVKCGVRSLTVAIDGATPETYRIYRVGGDFDRVALNIRELNRFKKVHDSKYPELTWQFVVFGHTEDEIPLAQKLAREWGMRFSAKLSWDSDYSPIRNPAQVRQQLGLPAVTREEFAETQEKEYMRSVCLSLWRAPWVTWDGSILGCCWTQKGFGGNAFRDGYLPAINNEKIRYARKMLLGEAPVRDDIVCAECKLYKRMVETGQFITLWEIGKRPLWYRAARYAYRHFGLKWARNNLLRR